MGYTANYPQLPDFIKQLKTFWVILSKDVPHIHDWLGVGHRPIAKSLIIGHLKIYFILNDD